MDDETEPRMWTVVYTRGQTELETLLELLKAYEFDYDQPEQVKEEDEELIHSYSFTAQP